MDGIEVTTSKDGTQDVTGKDASANVQVVNFVEGDSVVYPNHGAGCISGVEEKTIFGEIRRYYVVYLPDTELTVSIPADGETGLRACADEEGVEDMLRRFLDDEEQVVRESIVVALDMAEFEKNGEKEYALLPEREQPVTLTASA